MSLTMGKNLSALIGLAGAIGNNGKREHTDEIVLEALLSENSDEIAEKIREEKFAISPNCASCEFPCGNTSDYDLAKWEASDETIRALKSEVMRELFEMAERIRDKENVSKAPSELPGIVYTAITYLAYDLQEASYKELIKEMRDTL